MAESLMSRFKEVHVLGQCGSITNNTITSIIENLKPTMEELSIRGCNDITQILELKSMEKLRILNYFERTELETEELKKCLPHFVINQRRVVVAKSILSPENGIWEIKCSNSNGFKRVTASIDIPENEDMCMIQ